MMNLISVITAGVYILLTAVITLVSIGLIVLFFFLTMRERRRHKENVLHNMEIKTVILEDEVKSILIKAKSNTKLIVLGVHINEYSIVAAECGMVGIGAMNDILYRRLLRTLHFHASIAQFARDKMAIIIRKHIPRPQLIKLMEDIIAKFSMPIDMPGGREINVTCNMTAVLYPNIGEEFTSIITGLEFGLADSRRNGAGSCMVVDKPVDNSPALDYETYISLNKALSTRSITMHYRKVKGTESSNLYAIDSSIMFKSHTIANQRELYGKAINSGDTVWLDMLNYRKAVMQIAPIVKKSEGKVKVIYPISLPFGSINHNLDNMISAAKTYNIAPANIIVVLDCKAIRTVGLELAINVVADIRAREMEVALDNVDNCEGLHDILVGIKPNIVKIDAEIFLADTSEHHAEVLADITSLMIVTLAYNVNNSKLYDEVVARSIEYCMGDFNAPVIPLSKVLEEIV